MRLRSAMLAMVLAGCAGRSTLNDPHAGQLEITVYNEAGGAVCELHLFPLGATDLGHNWLQEQREIPTGTSRAFWVPKHDPADTYQVQVVGCPAKRPWTGYAPTVFMNGPASVILFDESNKASSESATELAHANENTTLIRVKFSRGTSR